MGIFFACRGSVASTPATFLDVILYSREQIEKENAAMKDKPSSAAPASAAAAEGDGQALSPELSSQGGSADWAWGIVSVKPQSVDYELPMNPTTIMRNALGKEEGGSGVPLDRAAYLQSVAFWQAHAIVQ
jgi:hypothetical protein